MNGPQLDLNWEKDTSFVLFFLRDLKRPNYIWVYCVHAIHPANVLLNSESSLIFTQVRHTLHRARRPHLPPQLLAQHGLRDVREPHPYLCHRLHQGPDEQLPGTLARPCPPTEHQHHLTKPADGEHKDQSGSAGNSRGGVPCA